MINKDVYFFELKRNFKTWLYWFIALGVMSIVMLLLFKLVNSIDIPYQQYIDQFGLSSMFGLSLKYTIGYFGTELSVLIQLAGAIYAASLAIKLLAGEEKDRTAEFLLANPISRKKIWASKLLALLSLLTSMVLALCLVNFLGVYVLNFGAKTANSLSDYAGFFYTFFTTLIMMLSIGCCCYLLSAFFSRRGGFGIAIGIALFAYIISIIYTLAANSMAGGVGKDIFRIVQYVSPFSFCDSMMCIGFLGHEKIVTSNEFWLTMIGVLIWIVISLTALFYSRRIYYKKDIL